MGSAAQLFVISAQAASKGLNAIKSITNEVSKHNQSSFIDLLNHATIQKKTHVEPQFTDRKKMLPQEDSARLVAIPEEAIPLLKTLEIPQKAFWQDQDGNLYIEESALQQVIQSIEQEPIVSKNITSETLVETSNQPSVITHNQDHPSNTKPATSNRPETPSSTQKQPDNQSSSKTTEIAPQPKDSMQDDFNEEHVLIQRSINSDENETKSAIQPEMPKRETKTAINTNESPHAIESKTRQSKPSEVELKSTNNQQTDTPSISRNEQQIETQKPLSQNLFTEEIQSDQKETHESHPILQSNSTKEVDPEIQNSQHRHTQSPGTVSLDHLQKNEAPQSETVDHQPVTNQNSKAIKFSNRSNAPQIEKTLNKSEQTHQTDQDDHTDQMTRNTSSRHKVVNLNITNIQKLKPEKQYSETKTFKVEDNDQFVPIPETEDTDIIIKSEAKEKQPPELLQQVPASRISVPETVQTMEQPFPSEPKHTSDTVDVPSKPDIDRSEPDPIEPQTPHQNVVDKTEHQPPAEKQNDFVSLEPATPKSTVVQPAQPAAPQTQIRDDSTIVEKARGENKPTPTPHNEEPQLNLKQVKTEPVKQTLIKQAPVNQTVANQSAEPTLHLPEARTNKQPKLARTTPVHADTNHTTSPQQTRRIENEQEIRPNHSSQIKQHLNISNSNNSNQTILKSPETQPQSHDAKPTVVANQAVEPKTQTNQKVHPTSDEPLAIKQDHHHNHERSNQPIKTNQTLEQPSVRQKSSQQPMRLPERSNTKHVDQPLPQKQQTIKSTDNIFYVQPTATTPKSSIDQEIPIHTKESSQQIQETPKHSLSASSHSQEPAKHSFEKTPKTGVQTQKNSTNNDTKIQQRSLTAHPNPRPVEFLNIKQYNHHERSSITVQSNLIQPVVVHDQPIKSLNLEIPKLQQAQVKHSEDKQPEVHFHKHENTPSQQPSNTREAILEKLEKLFGDLKSPNSISVEHESKNSQRVFAQTEKQSQVIKTPEFQSKDNQTQEKQSHHATVLKSESSKTDKSPALSDSGFQVMRQLDNKPIHRETEFRHFTQQADKGIHTSMSLNGNEQKQQSKQGDSQKQQSQWLHEYSKTQMSRKIIAGMNQQNPLEPKVKAKPVEAHTVQTSNAANTQQTNALQGAHSNVPTQSHTQSATAPQEASTISRAEQYAEQIQKLQQSANQQIVNGVKGLIGSERSHVHLQLTPESLGKLSVQLTFQHGQLTAQFQAEKDSTRIMMERNIGSLRSALDEAGIKVERMVISKENTDNRSQDSTKDHSQDRSRQERQGNSEQNSQQHSQNQQNQQRWFRWSEHFAAMQKYFS